jgi:hypothetical protein
VKSGLWCDDGDLMDYKKHINPISLIIRLIRTDPGALRSLVDSGTEVLFVGDRGYFRLDLDKFSSNELTRFKTNITKLLSVNTPIMDEYEVDDNVNSKTAIANVIIDKIEKHAGITISDTRSARIKPSDMEAVNHLQISSKPMDIGRVEKDNGIVIISVDPDGPTGFNGLHKTPLAGVSNSVDMYCVI